MKGLTNVEAVIDDLQGVITLTVMKNIILSTPKKAIFATGVLIRMKLLQANLLMLLTVLMSTAWKMMLWSTFISVIKKIVRILTRSERILQTT